MTERKSFEGNLQRVWDSTSLKLFLECPRKYYYTMIEGWTTQQQSVHLWFGSAVHAAVEAFEHAKAGGLDFDASMDVMLKRIAVESVNAPHDPQGYKTVPNLYRTMIWYQIQFRNDTFKTLILADGKPATELSFNVELPFHGYYYAGHLDRVVSSDNFETLAIMDHKTTKSTLGNYFFDGFNNDIQFTGYTFGGRVALGPKVKGVEVNGMSVQKTQSVFGRSAQRRSEAIVEEFVHGLGEVFDRAEHYAAMNEWPMNKTSCGHYGGCPFADVCSKEPSVRETWLRSDFTKRPELWDPAKAR